MSEQLRLQAQAQQLVRPLSMWFERQDLTRDLGRGTAFPATADVPGGLKDSDRFFRTDLGWLCFYDAGNTQWLTAQEWPCDVTYSNSVTTTYTATTSAVRRGNVRGALAPYFTRAQATTQLLAGTSNATNFWTVAFVAVASGTTIWSFDTKTDSAAATTNHVTTTMNAQSGVAEIILRMDLTKTLAPPDILPVIQGFWYRLVVP